MGGLRLWAMCGKLKREVSPHGKDGWFGFVHASVHEATCMEMEMVTVKSGKRGHSLLFFLML